MSKIDLNNVAGGFNLSKINDNFQKIETALNDGALWRDNPVGEPNQMKNGLDMNGQRIYNLPAPVAENEPVRKVDLDSIASPTKVLRVSDIEIDPLPDSAVRRNKFLSFDNQGKPVVDTSTASFPELLERIEHTVLTYNTRSEVPLTLPDGQRVWIQDEEKLYKKTAGTLVLFKSTYEGLSPLDFGATGNGVVDDTAAFVAFEATYKGLLVDLRGKIYYTASSDFTGNQYFNGTLINRADGSSTVLDVRKKGLIHSEKIEYIPDVGNGELQVRLRAMGTGSESIFQSIAYDAKSQSLVALRRSGESGGLEQMILEYFWWGSSRALRKHFNSEATTWLAHQALGIQNAGSDETYIWTRGGSDILADQALYARRCTVNQTTGVLENKTQYKIFDTESGFTPNTAQCLQISPDGTLLVASCTRVIAGNIERVVRVFHTSTFVTDGADYSKAHLYEFTIPKPYAFPLQAIATNGEFIYTLDGNDSYDNFGRVHAFTLQGVEVVNDGRMTLGRVDAKNHEINDGYTLYYEQEGLAFLPVGNQLVLCVLNMAGKDQNIASPDYNRHVALISSSKVAASTVINGGSNPGIISNSSVDVLVPNGTAYTVAQAPVDGTSKTTTKVFEVSLTGLTNAGLNFNYTTNTLGYTGVGSTVRFDLVADATRTAFFRVANPNRSGIFQASGTNTMGVFCQTTNQWLIGSTTTLAFVDFPLEVKGNILPRSSADNLYNIGSSTVRYAGAYINQLRMKPGINLAPTTNGELTIDAPTDTTVRIRLRGSDGVTRSVTLTLA